MESAKWWGIVQSSSTNKNNKRSGRGIESLAGGGDTWGVKVCNCSKSCAQCALWERVE